MTGTDPPGLPPNFPWRELALVSLSEGLCPDHLIRLRETGWCTVCQCWWRVSEDGHSTITTYPFPGFRDPEP